MNKNEFKNKNKRQTSETDTKTERREGGDTHNKICGDLSRQDAAGCQPVYALLLLVLGCQPRHTHAYAYTAS